METEKPTFVNKCLLGLQRQWDPAWTRVSRHFPHHSSPCSLLMSLVTALFREQARYANSFRQLGRRSRILSFGALDCSQLEIICLTKRHFGVVSCSPPQFFADPK